MNRHLLALATAAALASPALAAEPTRLTIYSGDYAALTGGQTAQPGMPGYALFQRPLHYTLKPGRTAVAIQCTRASDFTARRR